MKFYRLVLIANMLLLAFCLAMIALLFPFPWGLIFLSPGALLLIPKNRAALSAYGTGVWAGERDFFDMLDGNGLNIGEYPSSTGKIQSLKNLFDSSVPADIACLQFMKPPGKPLPKLLRLNNAVHTMVCAPTGVGKSAACAVPFLLTSRDNCVVVDFDGQLAKLTADTRRKMGHRVVLLDPWKVATQNPDSLNVLDFIDPNDLNSLDACRALAAAIVTREQEKGDGVHFIDNAEAGIAMMIAFVVSSGIAKGKSLQLVCDLVSRPDYWTDAIEQASASEAWEGMLARKANELRHLKDRELASTMTTINRFLRFLGTPAVAASTRASAFDLAELRNKKMTIYLILPPDQIRTQSALLRLWIGTLLRTVVAGGAQDKQLVHFVLDESSSLGHMTELDQAVDQYRKYGVRLQFYYQSLGQLKECWPNGRDQTLLSNVSQIYFGINDPDTAKMVSERLGKQTIIVTSGGSGTSTQNSHQGGGSKGGGSSSRSYGTSTTDNWSQVGRELLQPSEVMALDPRIAITFTPNKPPIWTTLVRYYEDAFKKRQRGLRFPFVNCFASVVLVFLLSFVAYGMVELVAGKYSDHSGGPDQPLILPGVDAEKWEPSNRP